MRRSDELQVGWCKGRWGSGEEGGFCGMEVGASVHACLPRNRACGCKHAWYQGYASDAYCVQQLAYQNALSTAGLASLLQAAHA